MPGLDSQDRRGLFTNVNKSTNSLLVCMARKMRTHKNFGTKENCFCEKIRSRISFDSFQKSRTFRIFKGIFYRFVVKYFFFGRNIFLFLDCMCNESVKKPCVFESLGDIQDALIMSLSLSYQNMNVWNAP
jgi:hypothetical protein